MISRDIKSNKGLAASDELSSDIWKRLTILKTEAWFDTVNAIAKEYKVTAKLENRYRKSAIIYSIEGRRIGRVWQIDENQPIFFDIKQWISHFEAANTLTQAIEKIATTAN